MKVSGTLLTSSALADASLLFDRGPTVVLGAPEHSREIHWGHPWQARTAAHWIALTEFATRDANPTYPASHQLGTTLRKELAACLLGGFGMPAETGLAAFIAICSRGLLDDGVMPAVSEIEQVLRVPVAVGAALRRYRFPHQRAVRLAGALAFLETESRPADPLALRDWLMNAPGIGPKTASWIVRNHYACDRVAILDIHVMRAGIAAGVFNPDWVVPRDYKIIEQLFLAWADYGHVRASDLDAVIWSEGATGARVSRRPPRPLTHRSVDDSVPFRPSAPPRPRVGGRS
jgi:N-glycosylase/DNA lyase